MLPLVPPYLTVYCRNDDRGGRHPPRSPRAAQRFFAAVLFIFGFSTVFIGLGATASAFGQVLHKYFFTLKRLAGVAIIVMGLHFLGVFRFALLYREARIDVQEAGGIWGAYIMGLAFGFGWTPCIGPILAANSHGRRVRGDSRQGDIALLASYSAGLGLPFLLAALAIEPFVRVIKRCRPYFGAIERVIGVLLVATGIAFLTGSIQDFSAWLLQSFPGLANLG